MEKTEKKIGNKRELLRLAGGKKANLNTVTQGFGMHIVYLTASPKELKEFASQGKKFVCQACPADQDPPSTYDMLQLELEQFRRRMEALG